MSVVPIARSLDSSVQAAEAPVAASKASTKLLDTGTRLSDTTISHAAPSTGKTTSAVKITNFGGAGDPQHSSVLKRNITDSDVGVALPAKVPKGTTVIAMRTDSSGNTLINPSTGKPWVVSAPVIDAGPWNTNDPYWETGSRPKAETNLDANGVLLSGKNAGKRSNLAGIDGTTAFNEQLGLKKGENGHVTFQVLYPGDKAPDQLQKSLEDANRERARQIALNGGASAGQSLAAGTVRGGIRSTGGPNTKVGFTQGLPMVVQQPLNIPDLGQDARAAFQAAKDKAASDLDETKRGKQLAQTASPMNLHKPRKAAVILVKQNQPTVFADIILESSVQDRSERVQVVETFGDFFVNVFGKRPERWTLSGSVIDTESLNWLQQMSDDYDLHWRGTEAVRVNRFAFLAMGNWFCEILILGMQVSQNSHQTEVANFTLQCLILTRNIFDSDRAQKLTVAEDTSGFEFDSTATDYSPLSSGTERDTATTSGAEAAGRQQVDANVNGHGSKGTATPGSEARSLLDRANDVFKPYLPQFIEARNQKAFADSIKDIKTPNAVIPSITAPQDLGVTTDGGSWLAG